MKTSIKVIKKKIDKSVSVIKRTKAKLSIEMLADTIKALKAGTSRDSNNNKKHIQLLDDKVMMVNTIFHSIDYNLTQCQNVVLSMKDTLDVQTQDIALALTEAEQEYQGRYSGIDHRMNAMVELIRAVDERNTQQYEVIQNRFQVLEERIPQLETTIAALENNVGAIKELQHKINERIIAVMRMSLMIIGVLAVTTVVMGYIYFKH